MQQEVVEHKPTLEVNRLWSKEGQSPFDAVEWKISEVHLVDHRNGNVLYHNDGVEHPAGWSQNAVDTVSSKYFRRADVPGIDGESSIRQLVLRVANCLAKHGLSRGYFTDETAQIFRDEIIVGFITQKLGFNSPVWFNFGLYAEYGITGSRGRKRWRVDPRTEEIEELQYELTYPGGAACFLSAIDDSLFNEGGWGMFDHLSNECRIFLTGAGDGANCSNIRGTGEPIDGGGTSAGLKAYLKPRDACAGYIKSGGKTRRSATLLCLNDDHPDLVEFITWKGEEEKKAQVLIDAGYSNDYDSGEAYGTISGQNSNNSVRASDEFMEAVDKDGDWCLISRTPYAKFRNSRPIEQLTHRRTTIQGRILSDPDTGDDVAIISNFTNDGIARKIMTKVKARQIWEQICQTAWECGCPGIQYDTTINKWNTVPHYGKITTTNPCFSGDTFIPTDKGLVRIGDWGEIGNERNIWHPEKGWVRAIAARTRDAAKTVTLTMTSGHKLTVTPDHRLQLQGGGEVNAIDSLGQKIALTRPSVPAGDGDDTDDTFTILGFAQGDGTFHKASNRFKYIYIGNDDADVQMFFDAHGISLTGDGKAKKITKEDGRFLGKWLKSVSLDSRDLNESIMTLSRGNLAKFLKGLFSANGSVQAKHNRISLKTCNQNLAEQVQQALVSLGIRSYITTNSARDVEFENGTYTCRESYDVNVTSDDVVVFQEQIGFIQSYKNEALQEIAGRSNFGRRLHPFVKHIEFNEEEEDVYDFQLVDMLRDSDRWACAGGLVAHNCAEICLPDWSVCNLASINLIKFFEDLSKPDWDGYEHACKLLTIGLDLVVDISSYPTKMHAQGSYALRSIGLNHGNIGAVLMRNGIPYDSGEGRYLMGFFTSSMTLFAWERSHEMAEKLGSYPAYHRENHGKVMEMHRDAFGEIIVPEGELYESFFDYGSSIHQRWHSVAVARGFRNNTTTCEVPQGTIGLVLDQDCTGCEPDFALVKGKKCVGGQWMKIVNASVRPALIRLGYQTEEIEAIEAYIMRWGTIDGAPFLLDTHLPIFDTAVRPKTTLDASKINLEDLDSEYEEMRQKLSEFEGPIDAILYNDEYAIPDSVRTEIQGLITAIGYAKTDAQINGVFDSVTDGFDDLKEGLAVKGRYLRRYADAIRSFSRVISIEGHIDGLAAIQPHLSMSMSKTCNMDGDATVEDVSNAYRRGWRSGVKCIAIYRDGSKKSQPLNAGGSKSEKNVIRATIPAVNVPPDVDLEVAKLVQKARAEQVSKEPWVSRWPAVHRAPDSYTGDCDQFTFQIGDPNGMVKVFLRVDRYPGTSLPMHVFIDVGKQGDNFSGLVDTMGRLISRSLQHGVPLEAMGDVLEGMTFGPRGMLGKTSIFGIRAVRSIPDLIGKVLKFLPDWWEAGRPMEVLYPNPYSSSTSASKTKQQERIEVIPKTLVANQAGYVAPPTDLVANQAADDISNAMQARAAGYSGESCVECGSWRTVGSHSCFQCQDCGRYNGPCGS